MISDSNNVQINFNLIAILTIHKQKELSKLEIIYKLFLYTGEKTDFNFRFLL